MMPIEEIKIESNIPAPDREDTMIAKIAALEIGDSFGFPRNKINSVSNTVSTKFHALTSKRFTVSVKGQPKGMARIWRLEDSKENDEN